MNWNSAFYLQADSFAVTQTDKNSLEIVVTPGGPRFQILLQAMCQDTHWGPVKPRLI